MDLRLVEKADERGIRSIVPVGRIDGFPFCIEARMAGLPELSAKLARADPQQVYSLFLNCILKPLRCLNDIQRSLLREQFSCKEKTECVCWDPPFLTNLVTFDASGSGCGRKSCIVYAIRCGSEPPLTNTLLQVELSIGLADVQKSVDTAEQLAQQLAFESSPDPARVAARVRFPSEPYLGTGPSRLEHSLPIGCHLPALDPKHVRAHSAQCAPKPALKSQPPKRVRPLAFIGIQELAFVAAQQVDIPRKRLAKPRVEARF